MINENTRRHLRFASLLRLSRGSNFGNNLLLLSQIDSQASLSRLDVRILYFSQKDSACVIRAMAGGREATLCFNIKGDGDSFTLTGQAGGYKTSLGWEQPVILHVRLKDNDFFWRVVRYVLAFDLDSLHDDQVLDAIENGEI